MMNKEGLYKNYSNDNILILVRTNRALYRLKNSEFFSEGINDVIVCKKYPEANIEAITMHRSKGLTADHVIVFGLRDNLFPSKGYKTSWLDEYFSLDTFYDVINIDGNSYHFLKENFPYAEERRLFYVALTRTKNKVYLVVPPNARQVSEFVIEIGRLI